MDFPMIRRRNSPPIDATNFINGMLGDRRPHVQEKSIPGGGNWVVQKFGGTSVGKFPVKIAEDIVQAGLEPGKRIAVVCSARSSTTKDQGTTNRLVRAAIDVLEPNSGKFRDIVETIRLDHLQAGKDACSVWGAASNILDQYSTAVNAECRNLMKILESAMFLKAVTDQTEDMVISVGEKLSCLYMAALLQSRGVNAKYLDLSEVIHFPTGKSLDENFYLNLGEAIAQRVLALEDDAVPIITGYFGAVPGGLLKEVGRGYTDLCAALTAVGLHAQELQIWKEVDGIFTADPRKVPTARLLDSVTPSEAAELTFYGSEVIHPFTMDQVIKASIPIRIKNVMNPRNKGTVVIPDPDDALAVRRPGLFRGRSMSNLTDHDRPKRPTAVTTKRGITVLNVHSKKRTRAHGFLMSIFQALDKHGLSVDLISSSEVHVSMALHSEISLLSGSGEEELKIENAALQGAVDELSFWGDVDLVPGMAIISLVGRQLRSMVGISGRFFSTLGEHGINIEMISQGASEINISCVIEEANADRALNVVHTNLFTFLD
ncbi:putative aspartate/glutamate/uridylate kinase, aspartate kinase, ACT domain, CASTOR, ACT [Septoria linicola]|nr:putative aspartate/glutamate/uridylate kinase, aspartate kinase, ACT domain, CASTOR, ACT [Septoria linicola]